MRPSTTIGGLLISWLGPEKVFLGLHITEKLMFLCVCGLAYGGEIGFLGSGLRPGLGQEKALLRWEGPQSRDPRPGLGQEKALSRWEGPRICDPRLWLGKAGRAWARARARERASSWCVGGTLKM